MTAGMADSEYTSNTRGARRYRFDEEIRRKRQAQAARRASAMPFFPLWLLLGVAAVASVVGFFWV